MQRFMLSTLAVFLMLAPLAQADTLKVKKGETIQSTIDEASAGDTVIVPKGVYLEVLFIPDSKPGLKLIGKGAILEARPEGGAASGAGITIEANDVTVSGFEIRHARTGANPVGGNSGGFGLVSFGARTILQKLIVRGAGADGISVQGADSVLQKIVVQRAQVNGIVVVGTGTVVEQVVVDRASEGGIVALADNVLVTRADVTHCGTGIRIGNNNSEVSKCDVRATFFSALVADFGQSIRFLNNRVDGADLGIVANAEHVLIEGNDLRNLRAFGINASGSLIQVIKNKVSGVSQFGSGILMSGSTIEAINNRVTDIGGAGLQALGGSTTVTGNRVQRAGASGSAPALFLTGEAWTVSKNKILDSRGVSVLIDSSSDGLFKDNQVQGGLTTGVRVGDGSSQVTLQNNTISNVIGEGIQNFGADTALQGNKVNKTRTPVTNDTDDGATIIDLGGNKFGKGASAAGAPQPEILD